MIQIIAGERGKGKTKFLLENAEKALQKAEGTIAYLDKNNKHIHELDIKIRLIDVSEFPVLSSDGFIGFVAGILSQDHDLEYLFLDSFLKLAHLEENDAKTEGVLTELEKLSEKFHVTLVISISQAGASLPESQQKNIIVSL